MMGAIFRRKKKNGELSLTWRIKYRTWDPLTRTWGKYKYESARTAIRREAERLLEERELEEERKSLGLSLALEDKQVRAALIEFLDDTHLLDREIPDRNQRVSHPLLDVKVEGTAWWIRTLDFAYDVDRFFLDKDMVALLHPSATDGLAQFVKREGGRRGRGVSQSTLSKTLKWYSRFCRWAVTKAYLARDPTKGFKIPPERVARQDRTIAPELMARFMEEYRRLPLKARVRVGLALWTGARSGEIETILVKDINPETTTVRRRIYKRTSGPQERTVRIPTHLMEDISRWTEEEGLGADDMLLPMRCQAGVKFLRRWRTTARGLRRTILTRLQDTGAPLRVIQEAAGHANLETTQRYLGVGSSAVSDALAMLDFDGGPAA